MTPDRDNIFADVNKNVEVQIRLNGEDGEWYDLCTVLRQWQAYEAAREAKPRGFVEHMKRREYGRERD